jgi:hypothetical protein
VLREKEREREREREKRKRETKKPNENVHTTKGLLLRDFFYIICNN